jgi:hypothetical protein
LRVLNGMGKREAARRPWRGGTREGQRSVGSAMEKGRKGKVVHGLLGWIGPLSQIGPLGQMATGPEERKGNK